MCAVPPTLGKHLLPCSVQVDVFMELSETPLPAGLNNFNISARTRSGASNVQLNSVTWDLDDWNHFDITNAFAGLMSSVTYSRECSTAVNAIFRINPATVDQSRLGFRIGWQGMSVGSPACVGSWLGGRRRQLLQFL